MSGECDKCGEHCLDCICENYKCPPAICSYGATITITGPVVCKDGTKFEDYTWEQHLQYLGFSISKDDFCPTCKNELVSCVCMGDEE